VDLLIRRARSMGNTRVGKRGEEWGREEKAPHAWDGRQIPFPFLLRLRYPGAYLYNGRRGKW
jgi:hypothetical protein